MKNIFLIISIYLLTFIYFYSKDNMVSKKVSERSLNFLFSTYSKLKETKMNKVKVNLRKDKIGTNNLFEEDIDVLKEEFMKTVNSKFSNNSKILYSPTVDTFKDENGFKLLIKRRTNNNLDLKPVEVKAKNEIKDSQGVNTLDVFSEELIEKELIVSENFRGENKYYVLFNKYPILNNHMLLVPKVYEYQFTHITNDMFYNAIYLMRLTNSIGFFNGGPNSGASQPRKHLQFIPESSFPENMDFGLNREIVNNVIPQLKEFSNNKQIDEFKRFKIISEDEFSYSVSLDVFNNKKHSVVVFKDQIDFDDEETYNVIKQMYYEEYVKALISLNFASLEEDKLEKNIKTDYTLILSSKYMFITERLRHNLVYKVVLIDNTNNVNTKEIIDLTLNINSIGFTGAVLVKDELQQKALSNLDILKDVYNSL